MVDEGDKPTDEFDREPGSGPAGVAEAPLIAPGRLLGERYRLERRLGHGGMAVVWLATDERLGRAVAVKVISDTLAGDRDYLVRFRREAHVAAGLQHPNLVGVYDFDAGARPYLVMEYVGGGDLAERLSADEVPDPARLSRELLSALRHIHSAGVLHRDIKPQNVLIDEFGNARLTDFGIAQPANATALTRTGHVIGTESYIAPEVKAGEPASERSDLYALGVVLADVAGEGAGAGLWDLIDRLRDPDPERRPQSAAAALATLDRGAARVAPGIATAPYAIDPPPAAARPESAKRPFEPTVAGSRSGRAKTIGALLAAVLAIALVAGLVIASGGGDERRGDATTAGAAAGDKPANDKADAAEDTADPAPAPAPVTEEAEPATEPVADTDPVALNDQGKALSDQGDYEGAIPLLEQARDALAASGDEQTYNYALYNLGVAYLGAGRPDDAIPVLEERLGYDDGQLETVEATLAEAYEAAGVTPDEKPGKGPKGAKTAPPFEEDDD